MTTSIIHLSDIHLKESNNKIFNKVAKLIANIDSTISRDEPIIFIISGDITYSCQEKEFDQATRLLDYIKVNLKKTDNINFIFCPGNHDCDFSINNSVRETLIESLTPGKNIDKIMYSTLTNTQNNYRDFIANYDIEQADNQFLITKEIIAGEKKFRFNIINSAWMSSINEKPGTIIIPTDLSKLIKEKTDLNEIIITVMHHPFSWFHNEQNREFQRIIDHHSDYVFLGHEHESDDFTKNSREYNNTYFLANEFQSTISEETSGYKIIRFDFNDHKLSVINYTWCNEKYSGKKEIDNISYNLSYKLSHWSLTQNFKKVIDTGGLPLQHYKKEKITLNDYYIEPRLTYMYYENDNYDKKETTLSQIMENQFINIRGVTGSGKTTLLKKIIEISLDRGKVPILINGETITTPNVDKLERLIKNEYEESYINFKDDDFDIIDFEKKTVLIDNAQKITLSTNQIKKVINYFKDNFSSVIITTESTINEKISALNSEVYEDFFNCNIDTFGHVKRDQLYRKWYSLDQDLSDEELKIKIHETQNIVDKLLGKGLLLPTPTTILLFLNQEKQLITNGNISIYSQMYDSIIHRSLKKTSFDDVEIRALSVCLSTISFSMFKENSMKITDDQLDLAIADYNSEYDMSFSPYKIKKGLCEFDILQKNGEIYVFSYSCFYYYFLAKHFTNSYFTQDIKDAIDSLFDSIHLDKSFQTLLFICYFQNNSYIFEKLTELLDSAFNETPEYEFKNPLTLIKDGSKSLIKIFKHDNLPEREKAETNRVTNLKIKDSIENDFSNDYEIDNDYDYEIDNDNDNAHILLSNRSL